MRRWGTYRIVALDRVGWYLARGWELFDLGAHHRAYAVGAFKRRRA
jgi:hypothetical protein